MRLSLPIILAISIKATHKDVPKYESTKKNAANNVTANEKIFGAKMF